MNPLDQASGRLWARHAMDPLLGVVDGLLIEWREGRFTRVERAARPPRGFSR